MNWIRATADELREELGRWWLLKVGGYVLLAVLVLLSLYIDIVVVFALGG